jgi:hypothetical protein
MFYRRGKRFYWSIKGGNCRFLLLLGCIVYLSQLIIFKALNPKDRQEGRKEARGMRILTQNKEVRMNCYFASTPRDVLHFLADYLLPAEEQQKPIFKYSFDLRNFVNTNKSYFGEWKKKTRVMVLMTTESEMFVNSLAFRNRVLSMIDDPLEQLVLQFIYRILTEVSPNFPGGARKVTVEYGKIHNVSISCQHIVFRDCTIQHLHDCPPFRKFELRDCTVQEGDLSSLAILEEAVFSPSHPPNLQSLAHLKFLKLYNSNSVTDVSCLRNIPKLEFVGCPNIKDISSLADVRELSLSCCEGIIDVSSLGKVHKLTFSCCDNIRDVSALGNVYELHLVHCNQVRDISRLKNVKEMHLDDFDGTDVSGLESVEKLFLSTCPGITDISMLKRIQVLTIQGCPGLASFQLSGLGKLRDLRFRGANTVNLAPASARLFDYTVLERLSKFESIDMDFSVRNSELTAGTVSLINLRELTLRYAVNISQLLTNPTLSHLRSLNLLRCGDLLYLPELPSLGYLTIESCNRLVTLHLVAEQAKFPIYSVIIRNCRNLKEVKVTRKISEMKIRLCDQLRRIDAQSQIGFLRADHCHKFNIRSDAVKNIVLLHEIKATIS